MTAETRAQLMNEVESRAKGHEALYNDAVKQYQSGAPVIGSLPALGAGRDQLQSGGQGAREMQPAMSPDTEARRQRAIEVLRRKGVAGY